MPSPVYLSLLNLRTLVDLSNNRWKCDCNIRGIQNRLMQMDLDQISQSWRLVCSSPVHHAGQELMQLKDQDLTCPLLGLGHVEHFDKVAKAGTQILLPCGTKNQGNDTGTALRYSFNVVNVNMFLPYLDYWLIYDISWTKNNNLFNVFLMFIINDELHLIHI